MIERRAAVRDVEPGQRFHEASRGELSAVVGVEREPVMTRATGHLLEHGAFDRRDCFLRTTAQAQIPAHDVTRAAVDHRDQLTQPTFAPAQTFVMSVCHS